MKKKFGVAKNLVKKFTHIPVLLKEVKFYLFNEKFNNLENTNYIDSTFGKGGYTKEMLKFNENVNVHAIDLDTKFSIGFSKSINNNKFKLINGNFADLDKLINVRPIHGIVFDLGLSSMQLDDEDRGFSFKDENVADLDMRMNPNSPFTAANALNNLNVTELKNIFQKYGDEKYSLRIAKRIVKDRESKRFKKTNELINDNMKNIRSVSLGMAEEIEKLREKVSNN